MDTNSQDTSGDNLLQDGIETKTKRISKMDLVKSYLAYISIGKYDKGLFHKGTKHHSNALSGLITLIIGISLLVYSILLMINVFKRTDYSVEF